MILLDSSSSDSMRLTSTADITLDIHASCVDNNSGTITPVVFNYQNVPSALTDIVPAPGAGQRNIKTLFVRNTSSTMSTTININLYNATQTVTISSCTLGPEETLIYEEEYGFTTKDKDGFFVDAALSAQEEAAILDEIRVALANIAGARGIAADLRVTLLGGTTAVTGTLTAVTTVGTVSNITSVGGFIAAPVVQGQTNLVAVQSNINNVIVT